MSTDRTVNLVFKFAVEGKPQIDQATSSMNSAATAAKNLESASGGAADGHRNALTWFDKLTNRITQGIPTMFTLVAAYKALQLGITLVKESMADLDEEFAEQRKMAQSIDLFERYTDAAGKAVSATENFATAMRVADQMRVIFTEGAKSTNFVWEDLAKASNQFGEALRGIGASDSFIAKLTVEISKSSVGMEDLLKKANAIRAFALNPRKTNPIITELGLGPDDIKQARDNGDQIMDLLDKLLGKISSQNDAMGTMPKTWEGIFHQLHESVKNAFEDTSGISKMQDAIVQLTPYIINFIKLVTPDLPAAFASIKAEIEALLPVMYTLSTTWNFLATGVHEINASMYLLGEALTKLIRGMVELASAGAALVGLTSWSKSLDQFSAKLKELAADFSHAADEKMKFAKEDFGLSGQSYDQFKARLTAAGTLSPKENPFGPIDTAGLKVASDILKEIESRTQHINQKPAKVVDEKGLQSALNQVLQIGKALELKGADSEYQRKQTGLEQMMATLDKLHDKFIKAGGTEQQFLEIMAKIGPAAAEMDADASTALEHIAARSNEILATLRKNVLSDDTTEVQRQLDNNTRQVQDALDQINKEIDTVRDKWGGSIGAEPEIQNLEKVKQKLIEVGNEGAARILSINNALKQLWSGDATAFIQRNIQQAEQEGQSVLQRLSQISSAVLENSNDFVTGIRMGVVELLNGIDTASKAAAKLLVSVGAAIHTTLADTIAGALTGDQDRIKNAFKALMNSIVNSLADYMASSLENAVKQGLGNLNDVFAKMFASGGQNGANANSSNSNFVGVDSNGYWNGDGSPNSAAGGAGSNWISQNGNKLLAGAVGAISLYQAARTGQLGVGQGALIGAETGAAVGGWIGLIVGAVVGAGAAIFAHDDSKDPENAGLVIGGFNSGTLHAASLNPYFTSSTEADAYTRRAQELFDKIQMKWMDALLAMPDVLFQKVLALPPTKFVFSDKQLNDAFNQQGISPPGPGEWGSQQPGSVEAGGKDYKAQFQLLFDQVIPQGMADSYRPIAEGFLSDLGFSEEKIKAISARWKNLGDDFIQEFQEIVAAVGSLDEIAQHHSFADLMGDAKARSRMTFGDTLLDSGKDIGKEVALLNSGQLSDANAIELFNRINQSATQMYNNLKQYMDSLAQLSKNVKESVNDQILGIKLDQAKDDKVKQKDLLMSELQRLDKEMQHAKTPEEIQALSQREQQVIGQIYQLDPKQFGDWAIAQLGKVSTFVDERIGQLGQDATDKWNQVIDPVIDALNRFKAGLDSVTDNIPTTPGSGAPPPDNNGDNAGNIDTEGPKPGGNPIAPNRHNMIDGSWAGGGSNSYNNNPWPDGGRPSAALAGVIATYGKVSTAQDDMTVSVKKTSLALDELARKMAQFEANGVQVVVAGAMTTASRTLRGRTDAFDTGLG